MLLVRPANSLPWWLLEPLAPRTRSGLQQAQRQPEGIQALLSDSNERGSDLPGHSRWCRRLFWVSLAVPGHPG